MRLSDAIALGSCLIKPRPGGRTSNKQKSGCALDMGMTAMYGGIWKEAWRVWPWLNNSAGGIHAQTWLNRIATKFDFEVMGRKTLTLEAFIDYVRSVEPPELEETANGDRAETSVATSPVCAK
jgi:hypothetical protein